MAATAEQPGVFLLEVADIGVELNTAFTKFIIYRRVHDRRLENLYATLSITTGCLKALGTTLNNHAADFRMEEDVTRRLAEKAKVKLVALLTMANEGNAEGGSWKSEGTINGQTITTEVDPWLLITMAVGGTEDAKFFWQELDDTRDALKEMEHIIKYKILKSMEEKNILTPLLNKELMNLKPLLPRIVQRHETVERALKAQAERLALIEKDNKRREERMLFTGRDSFASSDVTYRPTDRRRFISPIRRSISPRRRSFLPEPFIIKKKGDADACSVTTYFTNSDAESAENDTETIYEEWILRWNPPVKTVNRSWGFLGLKFKNYFEDAGFWGTDPEYRTTAEMKAQEKLTLASRSFFDAQSFLRKTLQSLPKKGGLAIDNLIDERTESTSHEEAKREWIVVAVKPKQKYAYGSSKKWGKDPLTTDWLVTIKGTTIDTKDRSRSYRRDDPFAAAARRARNRYSRSPSPYRPRYRSISPMRIRRRSPSPIRIRRSSPYRSPLFRRNLSRDRSPMRPLPILRNPARMPVREREGRGGEVIVEQGYVQGKVVVGKIMGREEAEEKMGGIWEGMVREAREPEDGTGEKDKSDKEERDNLKERVIESIEKGDGW